MMIIQILSHDGELIGLDSVGRIHFLEIKKTAVEENSVVKFIKKVNTENLWEE